MWTRIYLLIISLAFDSGPFEIPLVFHLYSSEQALKIYICT